MLGDEYLYCLPDQVLWTVTQEVPYLWVSPPKNPFPIHQKRGIGKCREKGANLFR
jgi:hypothetical protein